MYNYIKDQLDEWLIKIKPLLGLDDEWNYDETKDTIRKKVLTNDPELIEKYDQIMNINYTKIFTLDPLLDKYSNCSFTHVSNGFIVCISLFCKYKVVKL